MSLSSIKLNRKIRPPARTASNWADTEPLAERAARLLAWQEYSCCADCAYWYDEDETGHGGCGAVSIPGGALITPEDYTCDKFELKEDIWKRP